MNLDKLLEEVWGDACNAVCQTLQENNMCKCPDGKCYAALVNFQKELYEKQRDKLHEDIRQGKA